jgi:hypothetical protein
MIMEPKLEEAVGVLCIPKQGQIMRRLFATAVVAVLFGSSVLTAFSQTTGPAANPNAPTPPIATPSQNNPGAPAAGANSFTEKQAKARIEAAGYTNVSGLVKDQNGIWRGKATKGDATFDVALDFQGNVVSR